MHLLRAATLMARRRAVKVPPKLLVYDSFTNDTASDVLLVDHPSDIDNLGTGWQTNDPTPTSRVTPSDVVEIRGSGNNYADYYDAAGNLPVVMEVAHKAVRVDLALRVVDQNNLFFVVLIPGTSVELYERAGGVSTSRAMVNTGSMTSLYITDDGSRITIGKDRAQELISFESTVHAASTLYGFRSLTVTRTCDDFYLMGGTTSPSDLP